jgi:endoglucanase
MRKVEFKNKRKLIIISFLLVFVLIGSASLFAQMRSITGYDLVADMKIGWSLGNSFDALGAAGETAWGNPLTTQPMIQAVAARGFKTVRIPCSWGERVGAGPSYTIDSARLDRVQAVVDWCLAAGMYAIVDMHHEDTWLIPTYANETSVTAQFKAIWTQIANRFKNYNDYLVLEVMNEPRVAGSPEEWSGGTTESRTVINHLNQAGIDAIRATGGNNSLRWIVITTNAATSQENAINDFVVPNDSRILISQHTYYPYSFCLDSGGTSTWGTDKEKTDMDIELDRINNFWRAKGLAVVIGEWSSLDKGNTAARAAHAEYYAGGVRTRGMLGVWWDNGGIGSGGMGIFNRNTLAWYYPTIADGLMKGIANPVSSPFPGYNCSAVSEWSASAIYDTAGMQVTYNCKLYQNNWYSENQNPETNSGANLVWTYIGPCECAITPTSAVTPGPTAVPTAVPTIAPTAVPTTIPTPAPTPVDPACSLLGDVNRSGGIDIVDALLIAQSYVGLNPSNYSVACADVNCSSTVDIVDALLVAQYYVGLIAGFCL